MDISVQVYNAGLSWKWKEEFPPCWWYVCVSTIPQGIIGQKTAIFTVVPWESYLFASLELELRHVFLSDQVVCQAAEAIIHLLQQAVTKESKSHLKFWGWQTPLDRWRWWKWRGCSAASMLLFKHLCIGTTCCLFGLGTSLEEPDTPHRWI
jgi:hypothetical protein